MSEAAPPSDGDWCERFGASLAGSALVGPVITPELRATLLRIARDVAHGTERRNAPVAAFIAGRYVEARRAQGVTAAAALSEVAEVAARLLPDATP
jgi:Domain of unknown function (DUF6457)